MLEWRPGPLLLRAMLWLAALAAVVPLWPDAVWLLLAATLVVLGVAVHEAWLLRGLGLALERPPALVLSLGEVEPIAMRVAADAPFPLALRLRQTWPSLVVGPGGERLGSWRPGEELRVEFQVQSIARGAVELERPWAGITRWGLAERILPLGKPSSLTVLPNLQAVRQLHARLNQFALRGLGQRAAAIGKGRDFDRLREYVSGDDWRDIAWKASARHQKLITREYRLDRSQDIIVCLDRGHRMAARVAHLTRLDHAINAAMMLAYIGSRMEDLVGFHSFASELDGSVAPGRGAGHLRQLTAFASDLMPEYLHSDYLALAAALRRRLKHRSLVLILTVLPELEEENLLVRAVSTLVPQHLPMIIALSDPNLEAAARLLPATREELSRTLVARDVVVGREQAARELRRQGALVVEVPPGDAGVEAVNAYLEVKRRQLL